MIPEQYVEQFGDALLRGRYHLLLGPGVSRDSKNPGGENVKRADELRKELCALKRLKRQSSMSRVFRSLKPEDIEKHITLPFAGCKAGPTLTSIPHFVWSQIFTFNIDDAIEDAYAAAAGARQSPVSVNYSWPFEIFRPKNKVPIVHLHGFAREPESGYIFSVRDYAVPTREPNPWMYLLSDLLRTEPFILSGTSLAEPDLEHYLTARAAGAFLRQSELSLLVEPDPDAGTEDECLRFGLVLVRAPLGDFLDWVEGKFGPTPTVSTIVTPVRAIRYVSPPDKDAETTFFSDFELVAAPVSNDHGDSEITSFYFGRPPTWTDLQKRRDVFLESQLPVLHSVRAWLDKRAGPCVIAGFGAHGCGKTTSLKRLALGLSGMTDLVFFLKCKDGPDMDAAASVLMSISGPCVVCVDDFAEHVEDVQDLLDKLGPEFPILVLAVEGDDRREHVEMVLAQTTFDTVTLGNWTLPEHVRLIEKYEILGLVGSLLASKSARELVHLIEREPVAAVACTVGNKLRPLRAIATSAWNATNSIEREAYLAVALSHFCQRHGVRARILANAVRGLTLSALDREHCSLPVTTNPDDEEFLIPLNSMIADQVVDMLSREKPALLLHASVRLAHALAPYVTHRTITQQTAEARLASRLFDANKVVVPLLRELADDFYESCRDIWQWNSHYWEQRALAMAPSNLQLAIRHAQHAVALERHPSLLTTLAKLLLTEIEKDHGVPNETVFDEAFDLLRSAIDEEARSGHRRTKHPFQIMLRGVMMYVQKGFSLSRWQSEYVARTCDDVEKVFAKHGDMISLVSELADCLQASYGETPPLEDTSRPRSSVRENVLQVSPNGATGRRPGK